jgi:hypothetical protein
MLKCKPFMPNEADTCRTFVVPKLQASGWDADPHRIAEQRTFTDGRIFPLKDERGKRGKPKHAASNLISVFSRTERRLPCRPLSGSLRLPTRKF